MHDALRLGIHTGSVCTPIIFFKIIIIIIDYLNIAYLIWSLLQGHEGPTQPKYTLIKHLKEKEKENKKEKEKEKEEGIIPVVFGLIVAEK